MCYADFYGYFGDDFDSLEVAIAEYIAGGFAFEMTLDDIDAFKDYLEDLRGRGKITEDQLEVLLEMVEDGM